MERFSNLCCTAFVIFSLLTQQVGCSTDQTNHVQCLPGDRAALLDFKNGLTDPRSRLSSWRGLECCEWRGIACDNITGAVTTLDLHNPVSDGDNDRYVSGALGGEIRRSLMKLKSLMHLDLSSNAFVDIPIPASFGFLKGLQYLNLSNAGFSGKVPPNLGNLSDLQYLDLSRQYSLAVSDFRWITGLVSLKVLNMESSDLSILDPNWLETLNVLAQLEELHLSDCQLSSSISSPTFTNFSSLALIDLSRNNLDMFPNWFVNVSSLVHIDLNNCGLRGRIPLGLGELSRLQFLDLSENHDLSASCPSLFNGTWKSIEFLNLAFNKVHGRLPATVGNMSSLTNLDLSINSIEGEIPSTIGSLCKLVNFDISTNNMTGSLPYLREGTGKCGVGSPFPSLVTLSMETNQLTGRLPDWLGHLQNLNKLGLSDNMFEGPIPDSLGALTKLNYLSIGGNKLTGTIPQSIWQLSELTYLDVSYNHITGNLSEEHFSKLSKLKYLKLSANSFILNVSPNWLPPFKITDLGMGSCQLGPSFPGWLKSQNEIRLLDISHARISDSIPNWFWDLNFSWLSISSNRIHGELPRPFIMTQLSSIDLSSNLFEGAISLPIGDGIQAIDLSDNKFKGPIPQNISIVVPTLYYLSLSKNQLTGEIPPGIGDLANVGVIDLSRNNLTGSIPKSIGNCSNLDVLDLGHNNISGPIPKSLGQLIGLRSLHLNDNSISGKLPSSLKNLSTLELLDLSNNKLEDRLPQWLGKGFPALRVLNLRSNAFWGGIMFEFSKMSALQVLDLAENKLTGKIPTSLGDLNISSSHETKKYLLRGIYYKESLVVNWKNQFQTFNKTLSLMTVVDLSGNNLLGRIPVQLTKLLGLMVLNLSKNHFRGRIPESIGTLRQLESLDLSSNELSGAIPDSMTSLFFLGCLNLSNNLLSGKIPYGGQMQLFDANAYGGNPGLCGAPLPLQCNGNGGNDSQYGSSNQLTYTWYYLSIGLGFAAGILVPCLVLMIKRPWSYRYFDLIDNIVHKMLGGPNTVKFYNDSEHYNDSEQPWSSVS